MGKAIDLTGQKFNKLTVMYRVENSKKNCKVRWHCHCECGNEVDVVGSDLRSGHTQSCGCYRKERVFGCRKKINEYRIVDDYVVAKTSSGTEFYLDIDDVGILENYCFNLIPDGYLLAYDCNSRKFVYLHRLIVSCPDDMVVDHINGDVLDNRKSNLRIATRQQNNMNRRVSSNNTSGVTGVSFCRSYNKWQSTISVNGKMIHLGLFSNIEDAVAARRAAEERYFGEYSYYNSRVCNS